MKKAIIVMTMLLVVGQAWAWKPKFVGHRGCNKGVMNTAEAFRNGADFYHYDGSYRAPEYWKLYYRDGETWREVENHTPYGTERDCYNSVDFKPVTTTGLKIEAQLRKGYSGGIIEWKVN